MVQIWCGIIANVAVASWLYERGVFSSQNLLGAATFLACLVSSLCKYDLIHLSYPQQPSIWSFCRGKNTSS